MQPIPYRVSGNICDIWLLGDFDATIPLLCSVLPTLGVTLIKVYIDSLGGALPAAKLLMAALQSCNATIVTYCMGLARSTASLLFMVGDDRFVLPTSRFEPYIPKGETAILSLFASLPSVTSKAVFCCKRWVSPHQAVCLGFATGYLPASFPIHSQYTAPYELLP